MTSTAAAPRRLPKHALDVRRWVTPPVVISDFAGVPRDLQQVRIERRTKNVDAIADFARLVAVEMHDVDDSALVALARNRSVKHVALHRVKAKSLDVLCDMRALETLVIESATKIVDVDFVAYLTKLQKLSLSFLPNVKSVSAVGGLAHLIALRLEANDDGSPDHRWGVDTLAALEGCASLRALRVTIDVDDGRLDAFRRAPLELVELRPGFSVEELGTFAGAHPQVARSVSVLTRYDDAPCSKCERPTVLLRTGGRSLCRSCDASKIEQLETRWRLARDSVSTT